MKKRKEINWERWHWLRQHLKRVRKTPEPEEPQSEISKFLTIIFAAIPLITGGIYLIGMAYHFGECSAHGLDITEFPWPADVTLAMGFLQLLNSIKEYVGPITLGAISLVTIFICLLFSPGLRLGWAWFCHRQFSKSPKKLRHFFRRGARVPPHRLFFLLIWVKIFYDRFAILLIPPLLALMPAYFSFNQGVKAAEAHIKPVDSIEWTTDRNSTQSALLGDTPHIRLMCNSTHCAYRLKGGLVRLVRHDQVEQVTWMVPKDTSDNSSKESSTEK